VGKKLPDLQEKLKQHKEETFKSIYLMNEPSVHAILDEVHVLIFLLI
jgi:hypothetical protein